MTKIKEYLKTYFSTKTKIKIIATLGLTMIFLSVILSTITSFANQEPIKSIEILSKTIPYSIKEDGSWKITKSAKWISKGIARISLKVDTIPKPKNEYTDVILILDTSGSMIGDKLQQLQEDVNELIDNTIPKGNKIAIINFNNDSTILTDFTNDKEQLKNIISHLVANGETNYYQALKNADTIMKNYKKEDNRDCVILFLTDGLPNIDSPNQITQYKYLKEKYQYLTINGIQYEMGNQPLEGIKNITDNQYIATKQTLNKFLYRASTSPTSYKTFKITEYLSTDYFNYEISTTKNSEGKITIEDNKMVWNLDGLTSGNEEKLTIDIKLKEELNDIGGIYQTSENIEVNYSIGKVSTLENSEKTPILSDAYKVIYEPNSPDDCTAENMPSSKNESIFDIVNIAEEIPTCKGYKFKEWKIVNTNTEKINETSFIMPEEDVVIRAIWTQLSAHKTMDGKISTVQNLYQMMKDNSTPDNIKSEFVSYETGIKFNENPSENNGKGIYQDADTKEYEYPIYYYRGNIDNNNIIFANFCWKIVRTTQTGGIKLIYNGKPSNGKCLETRENDIGYKPKETKNLSLNYLYSTNYTYDEQTKMYTLSGNIEENIWNDTNWQNIIGKYTCLLSNNTTCSTIYQVASYESSTQANLYPLTNDIEYSQIGTSQYNYKDDSPADIGYMYGERYLYARTGVSKGINILTNAYTNPESNAFYYGTSIIYENETYKLQNPKLISWSDNYANLTGYYTCRTTSDACEKVYYILGTTPTQQHIIQLSNGKMLDDEKITVGEDIIDNNDGTYTLQNVITIKKKDWYTDYEKYKNHYICKDLTSTTCIEKTIILSTDSFTIYYDGTYKYIFGNDVEWDGENYKLIDTISSDNTWSNQKNKLAEKYHYTCLSTNSTCSNKEVYYVYNFNSNEYINYITLRNGRNIEQAKEEMFSNINSSAIKEQIDLWYKTNILEYTDRLEDTIWCNDRNIYSSALKGKDENDMNELYFAGYGRRETENINIELKCQDLRDSYTVSNTLGNGKLTYPIGLLTADEYALIGNDTGYNKTNNIIWTNTPRTLISFYGFHSSNYRSKNSGTILHQANSTAHGVRPSVSLKPGTKSTDGDGTYENPYIVK